MSNNLGLKKHFEDKLTQLVNRLSARLIIAGGLVSTALLMLASEHPPLILNKVLIGTAIFISAAGLYAFLFSGPRS